MFVCEKLRLYAHLIADWPRHNFHEKSKKSAGFFRFFLRILAFFTFAGTWNLQRPLEPEPGTCPLHRLGATVAEPEPGTSGTCWAGHRGTGTSEPWGEKNTHNTAWVLGKYVFNSYIYTVPWTSYCNPRLALFLASHAHQFLTFTHAFTGRRSALTPRPRPGAAIPRI